MEHLRTLIRLISPARLRMSHLHTHKRSNLNQLSNLYLRIHRGEIETDRDIKRTFFPESDNGLSYSRNLKSRLFQKLLDYIFLIEFENNAPKVKKDLYNCYKRFAAVNIMYGLGMRRLPIKLAAKTIKKAKKFGLHDIVLSLARKLQSYYGNIKGDKYKFEYYSKLIMDSLNYLNAEVNMEYYLNKTQFTYVNSGALHPEVLPEVELYCSKAHLLAMEFQSASLFYLYYKMELIRHSIATDYEQVVTTSIKAIDHFRKENWSLRSAQEFALAHHAIPALIQLKKWKAAEEKIEQCFSLATNSKQNYYIVLFYQVLYAFHSKRYQLAISALEKARPFKQIPSDSLREQWRIAEAYIAFFTDQPFKLGKFLNEMPIFAKDKRGNNVHLLIIQILFLLREGRYGAIIDRVEALNLYAYRHLRKDETFRSNCFIKMLVEMVKYDFHLSAAQRHAASYFQRLEEVPHDLARQGTELELVPFEELWKVVMDLLDEKRHIVRRRK